MKSKRDELIERLAATNPVVRAPDKRSRLDERAEADLETILSLPADTASPHTRSLTMRRASRARRLAFAAALVVVLAASGIAAAAQLALFDFRDFPAPEDVTGEPVRTGPREVIAAGRVNQLRWRFVGYESTKGLCIGLEFAGEASAASTTCGMPKFEAGVGFPTADYIGTGTNRTWFYGPVSRQATRVVLTLADSRSLGASVVPSPRQFALDYNFYLASVAGGVSTPERGAPPVTAIVAYDAAGAVIDELRR
jgi:hypothetical protein